jgi:tetratricopeptide (TPR) repeat protein
VCNAIEYAHTRGVLHRDIKPGNVIVGKFGETLVVDWGLAKAVGRSEGSDERTLRPSSASGSAQTLPGSAVGTPSYMSPEQARGDLDALGPRSDVYSLGATLYSLLTGKPPFEGPDVLRRVEAGDFPAPRVLDRTIDPALEAVCLKAMALKPSDRYATPRALADDVERWAADEPVSAWREPWSRRARRWARRNRTAVTAATAALVAGVIGLSAVAAVQAQANRQLKDEKDKTNRALVAETKAKEATTEALAQKGEALAQSEQSRKQAEAVSTFMVDAFRSPDLSQDGRTLKVADLLDSATEKLDQKFAGSPVIKGALLDALGQTYCGLGLYIKAEKTITNARAVRETALGPDHPDTLASRNHLASAYLAAGRTAEAITLLAGVLKAQESKLGPDHPDTLTSRNNLASAYLAAGRTAEGIRMDEETLKLLETKFGSDHPDTLGSRVILADLYSITGRTAEAIALYESMLRSRQSKLGPDHPDTLNSRDTLAAAYLTTGRTAEAVGMLELTLKLLERKLGPDDPQTLISRFNLAVAYEGAGRTVVAFEMLEAMRPVLARTLGPVHPYSLLATDSLASTYESLGRWAEAETLRRDALARRRKTDRPDNPFLALGLAGLGWNLHSQQKWSASEAVFRESLAIRVKPIFNEWSRFNTMSRLGGALLGQGRYAEAEPLVVAGYEGMKAREAKIPAPPKRFLAEAAVRVVRLYEAWGKTAEATAWKSRLGLADLPDDVFARP